MNQKFEWDEKKNEANILKHGIDFNDVPPMFDYPMVVRLDGREDYGEDRWKGIGILKNGMGVVVFIEKENDVIRLISARKANKHERKEYEKEITN